MNGLEKAIYERLTGDSTLMDKVEGVHNPVAPENSEYPLIIFQRLFGSDSYTLTRRIKNALRYQFRVQIRGRSKGDIDAILDRIDELLMDYELVADDTMYCRRESVLPDIPESDAGELFLQGGVVYRMEIKT